VATIYFSSGLARYTDGAESLTVDACRVDELLAIVVERFPAMRDPLDIMAVAVDGEVHTHPDFIPLGPTSEVHLVPRIAGGNLRSPLMAHRS
jgi:hypothetical protein